MAHITEGFRLPLKAASAIAQYVPVTPVPAGSSLSETVYRAGSINDMPLGFTTATVGTYGQEVSVQVNGVTKGIAGASLGAGALLMVGSTNGILIPMAPSAAATAMALRWTVGVALRNAAAADIFAVYIRAEQIV
ncbi:MAG TPA: hypothetical protein VIL92_06230 [Gaiellaceae bacterium]